MTSKHPLRRSCAFCRARKIKCSNETICEACRRQGADCIYDFEPTRPKARTISQDSSRSDPTGHGGVPGLHRPRSSTCDSLNGSPDSAMGDDTAPTEDVEDVAKVLEQKFYENFSSDVGPRSSPWQERISAYHRSQQASARGRPATDTVAAKLAAKSIKYTGILSLLTHDLVGLVSDQFGSLGCHHVEDGGARFFLSGLASDETQTMFDNAPPSGNPLAEYGQRQQLQLIDVWFSTHPLSFLVSKTLLLRENRESTHDEVLLATMLADANFTIGDEVSVARGHVLLRWATAQLRTRPFRAGASHGQSGGGGVSTRVFDGISTAQALMLLGWNALCSFQIRRACCYIGLAGRIASEIKEQISGTAVPVTSSRINGIDVFDVEKEVVAYLYWTTYSLSLWAFIQMGHGHFSALLPTSLTSIFLPVTEASSVIIQLDLVSENFSTLQRQKAVIREMWPLAHIASVVAYIFALYPQEADVTDSPTTSFWQEAPLLALQRIQQGKPSQGIACVCREINRVLMESIHILNRQVTEVSSRSLVLLTYHTMAINFLFPLLPPGQRDEGIAADVLERFCASAHEIMQIFDLVSSEQPQDPFGVTPSLRASFPDVFCLALDTCARALSLVDTKKKMGCLLVEAPMAHAYEARLKALAHGLYAMSQDDFLNQGRSLRMVRKRLKACVRALHGSRPGSNSSSSGVPSPDNARASLPHTPIHSPAAMMARSDSDHMSTFVSPMETTAATTTPSTSVPPSLHSSAGGTPARSSMPYSPADKPDWHTADDLFHSMLDHSALGAAAAAGGADHFSASDLVDLQHAWFPQMPGVMDLDMSGSMQWGWPDVRGVDVTTTTAAAASDMDSVLYYFENGYNKRPC
ncbi:hypothetical protein HRG_000181 [Hirsutella rhossiliensis]|uniref:Zn(2)-C6 fungal-type domain-containing protein n=1 Tax=Hirsutella rhossiliensis TaxID=111463 RepID=A0A9P8N6B4_9HYPO|nr:uncharacterized protein HRG_00181 [Hirsutella rhossiliensis]KAH0967539.1 hypothetical protein HRG_00181 [Hirsutella rhossiliensis]